MDWEGSTGLSPPDWSGLEQFERRLLPQLLLLVSFWAKSDSANCEVLLARIVITNASHECNGETALEYPSYAEGRDQSHQSFYWRDSAHLMHRKACNGAEKQVPQTCAQHRFPRSPARDCTDCGIFRWKRLVSFRPALTLMIGSLGTTWNVYYHYIA